MKLTNVRRPSASGRSRRLSFTAVAAGSLVLAAAVPATAAGLTSEGPAASAPVGMAGPAGEALAIAGVEEALDGMTLEEKVGQMFVPYMYGASIDQPDPRNVGAAGVETIGAMIEEFHPGGIIYFGWSNNLGSPAQIAQLSNDIQERATADGGPPMTISIDQEEGVVVRLPQPSTQLPGAMALGATRSTDHARNAALITARELSAVGINQNYSPIADVNSNAANPVIGVRAFGGDTGLVSSLVDAQVQGFQDDGGISASVKHFPGHGDTSVDSHYGVPIIEKSLEEFRAEDLPPFEAAIEAGVDSIMTAHIVVPALDPTGRPATLSRPILTDLLRGELGFDGVIVTDALTMQGVREEFGDDRVPVEAILAGADQMLMPPNLRVAYDGVIAAVEAGELTEERIDASVRRILEQKARRGVLDNSVVDLQAVDAAMNVTGHRVKAAEIADDSVTLLRNTDGVLPLAEGERVLLTGWGGSARLQTAAQELIARGMQVTVLPAQEPNAATIEAAVAASQGHDAVVVLTQSAVFTPSAAQRALVAALADGEVPVVQISVRNPYDVASTAATEAAIAVYSYADVSLQAAARVVAGVVNPTGRLPVMVPTADGAGELFPFGHGLHYAVVPAEVVFHDRPGRGQDDYEIPEAQGVDYVLDGRVLEPGAYRSRSDVTITAVPQDGYAFVDGAVTEWASAFTTGLPAQPSS